jgi:hypothetical protein
MKGNPMLAQWERDILDAIGRSVASVVFTLADGSTVEFDDVRVDSIGPSAENPGVVGVEFENDIDRIVHVPFVRYWEIEYR